jgi:hypothetical protein
MTTTAQQAAALNRTPAPDPAPAPNRSPAPNPAPASAATSLDDAVRAVTAALAALNADPTGIPVEGAIEEAEPLLDALEPGLTSIVLHRLLASIHECHREGRSTSDLLRTRRASAARALRLDPRRHAEPHRKAS